MFVYWGSHEVANLQKGQFLQETNLALYACGPLIYLLFIPGASNRMAEPGGKTNSLKQPREEISIKYMHRPPTITPNYGNPKRALLPKSKVSRVLLYDNATQDHMLEIKLAHMNIEKERMCRLINLHKRSFTIKQKKRHGLLKVNGNGDSQRLPELSGNEAENVGGANSRNATISLPVDSKVITRDSIFADADNLKLPDIHAGTNRRHVVFKVKDSSGVTRIYHTEDDKNLLNEILPTSDLYPKLTDDPRFQSLESILVPSEKEEIF